MGIYDSANGVAETKVLKLELAERR